MINKSILMALTCGVALSFMSCENQEFNDTYADAARVHVDTLSTEMQKVRDYVPDLAVVAHRGTTYWAPEETDMSLPDAIVDNIMHHPGRSPAVTRTYIEEILADCFL